MEKSKQKRSVVKIFLSHVSAEDPLAEVLKKWIETSFDGRLKVFVSSAIDDLPASEPWLDSLKKALLDAKALVVLCSPYSVTRPWVTFESGGAWVRKIPIISICHSGQRKDNLPPPLSFFHALEMGSPNFFHDLLHSLSKKLNLKVSPRREQKPIMAEIKAARKKIKLPAPTPVPETTIRKSRKKLVLAQKDKTILKKIATANNENCTCKKLAKSLKMHPNDLDVHLRYLTNHRFISRKNIKGGDCLYHTTEGGLNYLVRHKSI